MRRITHIVLSLLMVFALACEDVGTGPDRERIPPRPLTSLEKALVSADNSFGFKLLSAVNRDEIDKNVFISPVSVSMALGMTLNGANGATRDSMAKTLEVAGLGQSDINASYKSLIALLTALDPNVTFQIANSIWYRPELNVEQGFKDVNKEYFSAQITGLDFGDAGAVGVINSWVEVNTNGRIKEIVEAPISRDAMMYLINAIYFKGAWTYQFDQNLTRDDLFELPDGSKKACKMMVQKGTFSYFENDELQVIDLPYGDAGFSMTIMLPKAGTKIDDFVGQITQLRMQGWTSSLFKTEINLYLPKFTLEYEKKLNDVLKSLGMAIAFAPWEADFTNIDRAGGLFISEVKHKTFVQVDEEGTEAAAVTSVEISRVSITPTMRVDRPFVFAIRENHSGTVLFLGKIVEPKL